MSISRIISLVPTAFRASREFAVCAEHRAVKARQEKLERRGQMESMAATALTVKTASKGLPAPKAQSALRALLEPRETVARGALLAQWGNMATEAGLERRAMLVLMAKKENGVRADIRAQRESKGQKGNRGVLE